MNNSATLPLPLGLSPLSPVKAAKTKLSSASQAFRKYSENISQHVAAAKEAKLLRSEKLTPLQEVFAYEVAVALEEAYPIYGSICTREHIKNDTSVLCIEEQTLKLASEEVKNLSPYLVQVAQTTS